MAAELSRARAPPWPGRCDALDRQPAQHASGKQAHAEAQSARARPSHRRRTRSTLAPCLARSIDARSRVWSLHSHDAARTHADYRTRACLNPMKSFSFSCDQDVRLPQPHEVSFLQL
eukprot:955866-Pleurochrysis_carterae.AAC.1